VRAECINAPPQGLSSVINVALLGQRGFFNFKVWAPKMSSGFYIAVYIPPRYLYTLLRETFKYSLVKEILL